jgi:predicted component of type VI protein secretion system
MKLFLYYENVNRPMTIEIPDNEVEGFLREYEEALHDTSVESFVWRNSSFRIGGLMAIVQERHASLS